ncbi:MAG: hypothetical protein HRU20_00815 [Pseudomonadales bacterium]|nr:hypothetical protein [Pseudomonadales bacterium]
MSIYNINFSLDMDHRRYIYGKEPLILHCHHYNNYLQRTIVEDAPYIDSAPFLIGAAAEVSYSQLKAIFTDIEHVTARKLKAEEIFSWAGFGKIDLSTLSNSGGIMIADITHYSATWVMKFGYSEKPVDFFTTGWVAGALAAIYDFDLADITAKQLSCKSVEGASENSYEYGRGKSDFNRYESVGVGKLTTDDIIDVEDNNVDYEGVMAALSVMEVEGNDDGIIPAFGVVMTRHYANYYNRISFEFLNAMVEKFGDQGLEAATPLLIEAGRICAFNTFGGMMICQEWDALIKPHLKSKEDWVHGIVAAVNALGWGRWQVTNVTDQGADFTIHNDYESVGYNAMYGKSDFDVSFLAHGGVVGIMDLVYLCNIEEKPDLSPEFYRATFKGKDSFQARNESSRAMGDACTKFTVYR